VKRKDIFALSFMLFALFFGAGNMIFPPTLGSAAGENLLIATIGFILGDAGLALLAIIAVALAGTSLNRFGEIVGKRFSILFAWAIYLLIGPMFALPRTGTVAYELAMVPFVGEGRGGFLLLFTAIFFGAAYYLSSNPKRIVTIVGKILTPLLLLSIGLIFLSAMMNPFGEIGSATGAYATNPFFTGFMEGYNALDGPAGLAFATLVIMAVRGFGVKNSRDITKYTILSGVIAGGLLGIVYYVLAYLGACSGSLGAFSNGGAMLSAIAQATLGQFGVVLLGVTVLLACLTTAIGLITSFGGFVSEEYPRISYRATAIATAFFSFAIANVGLNRLIGISLPILLIIYPVTIVLILMSLLRKQIGNRIGAYWLGLGAAFLASLVYSLDGMGIRLGVFTDFIAQLPWYELGVGWLPIAFVASIIGYFIPIRRND